MLANNLNHNLKNWERSQKTKQNKTIQTKGIVVPSKIKKKENRKNEWDTKRNDIYSCFLARKYCKEKKFLRV